MDQLEVMGMTVKVTDEMVSLTDLWKAQGAEKRNRPVDWLRTDGVKQLVETLEEKTKGEDSHLIEIRKGKGGGTYAHWQLALAYAKHLSPELHLAVNDVFKRFMEADVSLAESVVERTNDVEGLKRIEARARNIASNKELNATIAAHGGTGKIYARVADINNVCVTGKPAKELRAAHNLPAKASTRPLLSTHDMTRMAFLEQLEEGAIKKRRAFGNDGITSTVADVAHRMAQLVTELTGA